MDTGRICTSCNEFKTWGDFSPKKNGLNGRESRCRRCKSVAKTEWVKQNPERHAAYSKQYRAKGGFTASTKRWQEKNRERYLHGTAVRAAIRKGSIGSYSLADWTAVVNRHGGRCAYCATGLAEQRDHVVPISRGGGNTIGNILPACLSCNSSKGSMTLMEWRLSGKAPAAMGTLRRFANA